MVSYFGKAYDAPIYRETYQVDTPVGQACMYCGELILEGEDGFRDSGKNPFHRECFLRMISGSVAHQMKACTCFLGDAGIPDEQGVTARQGAKLALAYMESNYDARHPDSSGALGNTSRILYADGRVEG